jgi:hypothetical protein
MTGLTKDRRICGCGTCGDAFNAALRLYQQQRAADECAIWNGTVTELVVAMHHLGVVMDAMDTALSQGMPMGTDLTNHAIAVADDITQPIKRTSSMIMEQILDTDIEMVREFQKAGDFPIKRLTPEVYMQAVQHAITAAKAHIGKQRAEQNEAVMALIKETFGDDVQVVNLGDLMQKMH